MIPPRRYNHAAFSMNLSIPTMISILSPIWGLSGWQVERRLTSTLLTWRQRIADSEIPYNSTSHCHHMMTGDPSRPVTGNRLSWGYLRRRSSVSKFSYTGYRCRDPKASGPPVFTTVTRDVPGGKHTRIQIIYKLPQPHPNRNSWNLYMWIVLDQRSLWI